MKKALLFFVPIAMLSACTKTEMTIVEEQVGISDVDLKVTRYLTGDAADVTTTTQAGFVLMGGSTDVDAAFEWMIERSGGVLKFMRCKVSIKSMKIKVKICKFSTMFVTYFNIKLILG